jgi:hypothetical protein
VILEILHLEVGLRKARRVHAVRESAKEVYLSWVLESKSNIVLGEDVVHV